MAKNTKPENPLKIIVNGKKFRVLEKDKETNSFRDITKSVAKDDHYGFTLIIKNKKIGSKKTTIKTKSKITYITKSNSRIYIGEELMSLPWGFDLNGNVVEEASGQLNDDKKVLYNNTRHLVSPATIVINKSHIVDEAGARQCKKEGIDWQNKILFNNEELAISPGLRIGGMSYGFKIVFKDKDKTISEEEYPTELNIAGIEGKVNNIGELQEVKVYENGKYNPWRFSCDAELISEGSFFPLNPKDAEFMKNNFVEEDLTAEQKYNGAYKKEAK